jgi:hypothetical protein
MACLLSASSSALDALNRETMQLERSLALCCDLWVLSSGRLIASSWVIRSGFVAVSKGFKRLFSLVVLVQIFGAEAGMAIGFSSTILHNACDCN